MSFVTIHTDATVAALDQMTGSALTTNAIDNAKAVLALRTGHAEALAMVLRKRAAWRVWTTVTQREWQTESRRPSRARHHDSIAIRERYVRCNPR